MLGSREILNYEYSIELIKEIDNKRKAIENNKIAEILMSKICIDLIRNFEEKSQFEDELNAIEEENKGIISDNINALETVGLNINEDVPSSSQYNLYVNGTTLHTGLITLSDTQDDTAYIVTFASDETDYEGLKEEVMNIFNTFSIE